MGSPRRAPCCSDGSAPTMGDRHQGTGETTVAGADDGSLGAIWRPGTALPLARASICYHGCCGVHCRPASNQGLDRHGLPGDSSGRLCPRRPLQLRVRRPAQADKGQRRAELRGWGRWGVVAEERVGSGGARVVGGCHNPRLDGRGSRDLCWCCRYEQLTLRRREPQGLVIKVPNRNTSCAMSRARLERATTCLKARRAKRK
jgi:hypothetical protein